MLCAICSVIDLDKLYAQSTDPSTGNTSYALVPKDRPQARHHTCYRDLVSSAQNGCDLCAMIWMRDLQRRQHEPQDCSVLGWEALHDLSALCLDSSGSYRVSVPELGNLKAVEYCIDALVDCQIYCCTSFTKNWFDGWEISAGPDISPPELRFYQMDSSNDTEGLALHSRLSVSVDEGKSVSVSSHLNGWILSPAKKIQ